MSKHFNWNQNQLTKKERLYSFENSTNEVSA